MNGEKWKYMEIPYNKMDEIETALLCSGQTQ